MRVFCILVHSFGMETMETMQARDQDSLSRCDAEPKLACFRADEHEERLRIRAFAYSSTASTMCSDAPSALSTPEGTGMPSIVSVRRPFSPPARLTM